MLNPGDKVNLVYYAKEGENEGQMIDCGWTVQEYDDGLLKVTQEQSKETVIVNLRSSIFVKVEFVE